MHLKMFLCFLSLPHNKILLCKIFCPMTFDLKWRPTMTLSSELDCVRLERLTNFLPCTSVPPASQCTTPLPELLVTPPLNIWWATCTYKDHLLTEDNHFLLSWWSCLLYPAMINHQASPLAVINSSSMSWDKNAVSYDKICPCCEEKWVGVTRESIYRVPKPASSFQLWTIYVLLNQYYVSCFLIFLYHWYITVKLYYCNLQGHSS